MRRALANHRAFANERVGPAGATALLIAAVVAGGCRGDGSDRAAGPPAASPRSAPLTRADPAPDEVAIELPPPPPLAPVPVGLPAVSSPEHNPTTAAKVALGRLLFFDPRLSAGRHLACATCHRPDHGWSDDRARSAIWDGKLDQRHSPGLEGTAYAESWPWDGGMPSLEALVLSHWKGQLGGEVSQTVAWLGRAPIYRAHFGRAFAEAPGEARAAEALAAYLRTLVSGGAPWDHYEAGDRTAVTPDAIAGARVFADRAGCATCHPGPLYSDLGFHARRADDKDPGRQRITGRESDRGAFKTPSLRGALARGPFFHDGGVADLEAAIDAELSASRISLTPAEHAALVAFIRTLTPARPTAATPELPPDP